MSLLTWELLAAVKLTTPVLSVERVEIAVMSHVQVTVVGSLAVVLTKAAYCLAFD